MVVPKIGKGLAVLLFITAIVAIEGIDLKSTMQSYFILFVVGFQLVFSVALYIAAERLKTLNNPAPYKNVCWVGVLYALLLSAAMGVRQYEGLGGFTVVLPVTTLILFITVAAPFLWSLKRLRNR